MQRERLVEGAGGTAPSDDVPPDEGTRSTQGSVLPFYVLLATVAVVAGVGLHFPLRWLVEEVGPTTDVSGVVGSTSYWRESRIRVGANRRQIIELVHDNELVAPSGDRYLMGRDTFVNSEVADHLDDGLVTATYSPISGRVTRVDQDGTTVRIASHPYQLIVIAVGTVVGSAAAVVILRHGSLSRRRKGTVLGLVVVGTTGLFMALDRDRRDHSMPVAGGWSEPAASVDWVHSLVGDARVRQAPTSLPGGVLLIAEVTYEAPDDDWSPTVDDYLVTDANRRAAMVMPPELCGLDDPPGGHTTAITVATCHLAPGGYRPDRVVLVDGDKDLDPPLSAAYEP